MKKFLFFITCILVACIGYGQSNYYYYRGMKIFLNEIPNSLYITTKSFADTERQMSFLEDKGEFADLDDPLSKSLLFRAADTVDFSAIKDYYKNSDDVETYSSAYYIDNMDEVMLFSSRVMLTLKNREDSIILQDIVRSNNYSIEYVDPYDSVFYVINTGAKDGSSSLKVAAELYESQLFKTASPDFYQKKEVCTTINDSLYPEQWNLHYVLDTNVDINAEQAWTITTGNGNVIVAVIDYGVELDHPDLVDNLTPGYDAITQTFPAGAPHSTGGYYAHGTKCTGVIVAKQNNTIGLTGIAPNCKVMPICSLGGGVSSYIRAFNYAKNNSASVLNLSWSSSTSTDELDASLQDVVNNGRNGKGCVVVTAAGLSLENDGLGMSAFPRYIDGVIVVGSTNKCGTRLGSDTCTDECSSCPGEYLSVMAPGHQIPTTTQGHGYWMSNCTSISSAQVAGVAALVLSVNPNLTAAQVKYILESTAQKTGGYNYTTEAGYPNGTWNTNMGYGLVDAFMAVKKAQQVLTGSDLYIKDNSSDNGVEPNTYSGSIASSPDIWITDANSNVVTSVTGGEQYQVHVKIRNRRSILFLGGQNNTVSLKWTIADGNLKWNQHWISAGSLCGVSKCGAIATNQPIGIVFPSSSVTKVFNWTAPSFSGNSSCTPTTNSWTLSVVAYFNDGGIVIGNNSTDMPIDYFVRQNNNVAMKTFTLYKPEPINPPVPLVISPNPSNGIFTIEYHAENHTTGNLKILITNQTGELIQRNVLTTNQGTLDVNMSGMPTGQYMAILTNGQEIIGNARIIIH